MRQLKITKQVTNRETASLDKYLQEIGKVDLITAEEEVELAQRIKAGDQVALEKLTKANLRFVVSVAKQYQNQGLTLPDLINEGNLGLIKAAQRFDETRGFKFISYAVWWIRQSILQALAEQSRIVRLPLNKIGSINKINKTYAFLANRGYLNGLANEMGESTNSIRKELALIQSGFPTNRFVFEGFLPQKKGRQTRIENLACENRTIIIYESPHRVLKTLNQFLLYFEPDRKVSVVRELTKKFETQFRGSISEATEYYSKNKPKGEFVILISPEL